MTYLVTYYTICIFTGLNFTVGVGCYGSTRAGVDQIGINHSPSHINENTYFGIIGPVVELYKSKALDSTSTYEYD